MENLIDIITSNTLYLVLVILIAIMIIITILKKLFKLFLVSLIVLALYLGFMVYKGEKIPTNSQEIMDHLKKKKEELHLNTWKEKGKEAIKEEVKKGVGEEIDKR